MTMMRAIMQLAGLARIRYNDREIYEYNVDNPQSHFRGRKVLQDRQIRMLDARRPLQPVASYAVNKVDGKSRTAGASDKG